MIRMGELTEQLARAGLQALNFRRQAGRSFPAVARFALAGRAPPDARRKWLGPMGGSTGPNYRPRKISTALRRNHHVELPHLITRSPGSETPASHPYSQGRKVHTP